MTGTLPLSVGCDLRAALACLHTVFSGAAKPPVGAAVLAVLGVDGEAAADLLLLLEPQPAAARAARVRTSATRPVDSLFICSSLGCRPAEDRAFRQNGEQDTHASGLQVAPAGV